VERVDDAIFRETGGAATLKDGLDSSDCNHAASLT
jgi:hypothetical protein